MKNKYKAYLIVRRFDTGEEVHRVGLSYTHPYYVDKVMSGLLRNMDTDTFYVDDFYLPQAERRNDVIV